MQFNQQEVQQFLSKHLQAEITGLLPVGYGEWSKAFYFQAGSQHFVIRFSPLDEDFRKDQFAARFSAPCLPIPPVQEIGHALDSYYAITPRVHGEMIDHLDASRMRQTLPALMDLFTALQQADTSPFRGFGGFGPDGQASSPSWKEFLLQVTYDTPERRIHGWKQNLKAYPQAYTVFQQSYRQFMQTLEVCPEDRCLVHNDLLHYNLIIEDNKVAGVIDWGCALYGDFLYDLAMFTTWQFYYPAMQGIDLLQAAQQHFHSRDIDLTHFLERVQCYQIHLLLDSLSYNAYKQNLENLDLTVRRLKESVNL